MKIDFSQFTGREQALKKIIRYHRYSPMYYRTNLWQHSHRLVWMIEEMAPTIESVYPNFKKEEAQLIAHVHDDLEIVLGDIMLGEKLSYTAEQKKALEEKERAAIEEVSNRFPSLVKEYTYKDLLLRYQNLNLNDLEAVVVKYCDKYDAFGEALHEIFAGNEIFTRPYEAHLTSPIDAYLSILQTFDQKYPLFEPLRNTQHPFFLAPLTIDPAPLAAKGKLHTLESLHTPSEYRPYEIWKQIVLNQGGTEGMSWLTTKIE